MIAIYKMELDVFGLGSQFVSASDTIWVPRAEEMEESSNT